MRRHGALEARCKHAAMEVWRCGALSARCRCSDVEARRHGALEPKRRAEGVQTMEVWTAGNALQHVDVKAWRYGSLDERCRCSAGEVWR